MQDLQLQFCTAQNHFANAGSSVDSTDWIDMKAAMDNAAGNPLEVGIIVTTAFDDSAAGTASFCFQLLACEADGSNGVVIAQTRDYGVSELAAGRPMITLRASPQGALPAISGSDPRQALRVRTLTKTTNGSAGAISAFLGGDIGSARPAKAYPAT